MHAWEFAKAQHMQREHGWARFVSMQDHYNLLAREEEREMIPLCLDEGIGTVIWSPLARGRLARPWEQAKSSARAEDDGWYADLLYPPATIDSDRAIIAAVGEIAEDRGVSGAQIALAWLHSKRVVNAPLVGANKTPQIDDAVASLAIELTADELGKLEDPYTPRSDYQGVSDEAEMQRIIAHIPGYANA
jgi:1-deoxyxylulose-5-phosphate synthase